MSELLIVRAALEGHGSIPDALEALTRLERTESLGIVARLKEYPGLVSVLYQDRLLIAGEGGWTVHGRRAYAARSHKIITTEDEIVAAKYLVKIY